MPLLAERSYDVFVRIEVNDERGVIGRYVDGAEEHPYGLATADAIYDHLAYNAIANGVERVNRLDGWADLADDAATMVVESVMR